MFDHDELLEVAPAQTIEVDRQRILAIDDDRDQVETMAYALRRQGFDVLTAHSIQAGRMAVDVYRPHLIILDIRLPDGCGLELCQDLADDTARCHIPVIVLSGMERSGVVRQARAAGCHFFLRKPYDPNALLLLAENAIGRESVW